MLNHITRGFQPFTIEKGGKIPRDFFKSKTVEEEPNRKKEVNKDGQHEEENPSRRRVAEHTESKRKKEPIKERKIDKDELKMMEELDEDKLFIYKNNFVRGVIDKAQFGDYGLVHTVHELCGSNTAGLLLSSLSRLFTVYLQVSHFTRLNFSSGCNGWIASLVNHLDKIMFYDVYDSDARVHMWSQ